VYRSAHIDTFTRDNLPPEAEQPVFLFDRPELQYPERVNCIGEFLDRWVEKGIGGKPCLSSPTERWTYEDLYRKVNRIANVLVTRFGLVPGNRVLLRSANSPMMVAVYFAIIKAGGVVVATMPLLRAKELAYVVNKSQLSLAVCDHKLSDEMEKTRALAPGLTDILYWGDGAADALETLMDAAGDTFAACDTASDDVCLIGFTSGTTGEPKGTMHFHRDMLAICDGYARNVLRAEPDDVFIGSPPLAFTFGLGGLVLFPLRIGASAVLLEKAAPDILLAAIEQHRATICFTAPTAYRVMLAKIAERDVSCLRKCVSAGEALPKPTFDAWLAVTGLKLMDGIGATEMLHIFVSAREDEIRPGAIGRAVPGYEATVLDEAGAELPSGTVGRLAVRGPTGCRYLADERQRKYVVNGWNVTGDTCIRDEDGYFWYQARSDDMIVTAGYNVAGPEVEATLLDHPAVAECGVIGVADADRGTIVKAFIVLRPGFEAGDELAEALAQHVKTTIAPYKYPRAVAFVTELPRTSSGKLQRAEMRRLYAQPDASRESA